MGILIPAHHHFIFIVLNITSWVVPPFVQGQGNPLTGLVTMTLRAGTRHRCPGFGFLEPEELTNRGLLCQIATGV